MRRRPAPLLLTAALLLGGTVACSSSDGDAGTTTTTAGADTTAAGPDGTDGGDGAVNPSAIVAEPEGELAEADCWWPTEEIDPAVTLTCSTLTVPADWNDPGDDAEVVLPIVRLHHRDVEPDVAPLVSLHGGPGGSSLAAAPVGLSEDVLVRTQDVILWDQRGSGFSTPSLNCPEKERAVVDTLATREPLEDELATNLAAVEACRDRLRGEGIDLDHYNTIQSVNDAEALRAAMGADTWNVMGGSYGTRLGLAYAREHPDRVRALVLDSVYPPEVGGLARIRDGAEEAIARLVDECAADDACQGAFGDLGEQLANAEAALDGSDEPVTATVEIDGEPVARDFLLAGSDLRSGMFAALYQKDLIPLLPSVIASVADGDRSILGIYIDSAVPLLTQLSEGAYYSVDCADGGRLLDGATPEDVLGDGATAAYALTNAATWCGTWGVAPLDASFNEPALPEAPTLVYAGTLDPVTPYADSKAQAEAMPDARLVTVPRGGHGEARWDDCTTEALVGFLTDPAADLPACTASIPAQPFIAGG